VQVPHLLQKKKRKNLCGPEEYYYKQIKKLSKGFGGGELLLLFAFTIKKILNRNIGSPLVYL